MDQTGEDWQRWNIFATVVANEPYSTVEMNSSDSTVEVNHDGPTIEPEPEPLQVIPRWQVSFERWYESLITDPSLRSQDEEGLIFEELLSLVEQIGEIHIGLDIEIIDEHLNRRKYEKCCDQTEYCVICLEMLKTNEDVSKLQCGHDFHFDCIKSWLMVKNICPLCRQIAL